MPFLLDIIPPGALAELVKLSIMMSQSFFKLEAFLDFFKK